MNSRRGFSLLESLISLAVLSGMLLLLALATHYSESALRHTVGSVDASTQLKRAAHWLRRDLLQTSKSKLETCDVPVSAAGLAEGKALWFLSCLDASGKPTRDNAGNPAWKKNILYYSIKPQQHDSLAGITCQPGGPSGLDDFCAHKVLIRKEIRYQSGSGPEVLIPSSAIASYLKAPNQLDFSVVRDTPDQTVTVLARQLLAFDAQAQDGGVDISIQAVELARARREIAIGNQSLSNSKFTQSYRFQVLPDLP
ncbi:prepilin-type N-terminal cleavage/methylation domain-containing protein [bacterium]|nr:prepilin-type N-terminal cleavage/methylation domain-containing protein [bacterium]